MADLNVPVLLETVHKSVLESDNSSAGSSTDPAKIDVWAWALKETHKEKNENSK